MVRKWTREERRKKLREKYYTWREKGFVIVVFISLLFIVLSLALSGTLTSFSLQLIVALLIVIIAALFFMVFFGGAEAKIPILILAVIFIILLIVAGVMLIGVLTGIEQLVVAVILGLIFLILIAISAFFIDMIAGEAV